MEDWDAFMENDMEDDFVGVVMLKLPKSSFEAQAKLVVGNDWREKGEKLLKNHPEALKIFRELYL